MLIVITSFLHFIYNNRHKTSSVWLTTQNTGIVSRGVAGSHEIWRIPRKVGDPGIYKGFREISVIPWNLSYPKVMAKFPGTMRPHF